MYSKITLIKMNKCCKNIVTYCCMFSTSGCVTEEGSNLDVKTVVNSVLFI